MHATNAEGNGSNSVASASTIPATVPSTPAQPTISAQRHDDDRRRSSRRPTAAARSPATPRPAPRRTAAPPDPTPVRPRRSGSAALVARQDATPAPFTRPTPKATALIRLASSAATVPAIVPALRPQPTVTPGTPRSRSRSRRRPAMAAARSPATPRPARRATVVPPARNTGATLADRRVSALTNGKTYTCTVHATNTVGSGRDVGGVGLGRSRHRSRRRPADADGHARQRTITVTFVAPANGGSPITGYTATCTSSNGGAAGSEHRCAPRRSRCQSLTNGKTYTCTVARDQRGRRRLPSRRLRRRRFRQPCPTRRPSRSRRSATARSRWRSLLRPTVAARSPATRANCTSSDGGTPRLELRRHLADRGDPSHQRQDLHLHRARHERVGQAARVTRFRLNRAGNGAERAGAPTRSRRQRSISVAFVAPATGGIRDHRLHRELHVERRWCPGSNSGATSPIVVSALTTARPTPARFSPPTWPATARRRRHRATVVPATVPSAPAGPTLTHGNAQISVAFVAPADGGTAITGYTANCTSSDGGTPGRTLRRRSPIVVPA